MRGVAPKGASTSGATGVTTFGKSTKKNMRASYTQFPDIPFPAGATINSEKTTVVGSKPWYGLLALTSSSSAGLMFEFYDSKMENYKWQKIASVRAETSILTFMKQDRVISISIQERALGGSLVIITSSPINNSSSPPQSTNNQDDLMPVPVQKIK